MRVLLTALRMAGHYRPILPYAKALQNQGHEVLFAASTEVATVLEKEGLPHGVLSHPGDKRIDEFWANAGKLPPDEFVGAAIGGVFVDLCGRFALPDLRAMVETWKPDLIIRENTEFSAVVAAEEAGVPHIRIAITNGKAEDLTIKTAAPYVDAIRRDRRLDADEGASMRNEPVFTSFPASFNAGTPVQNGVAPFLVKMPEILLDPALPVPTWATDDGRPLVFITFGTMTARESKNHLVYRAAIEAVAELPIRAVFSTGTPVEDDALGPIPDNLWLEQWVDQRDIYPRAQSLVCHGGAGTMLAGMSAGLPMVVAPFFGGQPDNAKRIEKTGAGVALFEPDKGSFKAAIEQSLNDPKMRANAAGMAADMAQMPSLKEAIEEFERLSLA